MKILVALTYYRPYISGVTIYNQRLAEGLARRRHQVTVLTSQYDASLPAEELLGGVTVVRLPVGVRISKGALMRGYGARAAELIAQHDAVLMSLPNTPLEALTLTRLARRAGKPIAGIYHCDVTLPPGLFNALVTRGVAAVDRWAGRRLDRVTAYTVDYALHSRLLRTIGEKVEIITPPVVAPPVRPEAVADWRRRFAPGGERLIGFAARLAPEKGVEYLLQSLPQVERAIGGPVRLLMVGENEKVIGESLYRDRLRPMLTGPGSRCRLLGELPDGEMGNFYAACDVTALPSVNSTESFGIVQVESMLCGTPVVASSLPGVRVPIQVTGMGRLSPPRDTEALAKDLAAVLLDPERYRLPRPRIEALFSADRTVDGYEAMLERLLDERRTGIRSSPTPPPIDAPALYASRRDHLSAHLREVPPFRALLRSVECKLLERMEPLEQPVLDLGCGDGHFASMAFSGPVFAGVDSHLGHAREARRTVAYRHLLRSDATALPFRSASMRTVVANSVLEHIAQVDRALSEVSRVLQPGGRLVLTVPSHRFADLLFGSTLLRQLGHARLSAAYGRWFNRISFHYHCYSHEAWLEKLAAAGFIVDEWQYYLTPQAHRAFELGHWLGVPLLVSHKLIGRWVPLPSPINGLYRRWLQPHCNSTPVAEGPYLFFVARKTNQ